MPDHLPQLGWARASAQGGGVGAGPRMEWGALAALPAPTQGLARVCEAWRGASLVPSAGPSPACGGAGGASNDPESPEGVPAPATAG